MAPRCRRDVHVVNLQTLEGQYVFCRLRLSRLIQQLRCGFYSSRRSSRGPPLMPVWGECDGVDDALPEYLSTGWPFVSVLFLCQ